MGKKDSIVFAGGEDIEEENLAADFDDLDDGIPTSDLAVADNSPPPPPDKAEQPEAEQPEAEQPEAEPPAETETETEADDRGTVPSWRLAQEAARRRQAEKQVEEIQAYYRELAAQQQAQPQQPQPQPQQPQPVDDDFSLDFGDDPKQMFDKALDGDLDTAKKLFGDMVTNAAKKAVDAAARRAPANQQQPQIDLDSEINRRVVAMRYREQEEQVISQLEHAFPVFNPRAPEFNRDMVEEVLTIQEAYIAKQFTPAEAMERAALMVLKTNNMVSPPPSPAAKRSPDAVARNVDAHNRQPPSVPVGSDNQQPLADPTKMTEEEFSALPDSVIARLRGDFA